MRNGGLETILAIGSKYKNDEVIVPCIVGLLGNLSAHLENGNRREISTDECVGFVIGAMEQFSNDRYTQNSGCRYFWNIADADGVKEKLLEKNILTLLGSAADCLRTADEDLGGYERAKETLVKYST